MSLDIDARAVLSNGVEMPWLGLGVFRSADGTEVEQAISWALEMGYRSVDTAAIYGNEAGTGRALRASGLPREAYFVTTKVWNSAQGYDATLRAFDESMGKLGLDVLDLYLIHWPVKDRYKETWRAFEHLYTDGRVRAIGVSNFLVHHLEDLLASAEIAPMVNQVEFHPRLMQRPLLEFCRAHGIQLEAWSPIMKGRFDGMPELLDIAEKHERTPAQILLRWDLQHGVITIPKSVRRERIAENAAIFDFRLDDEDMARLDAMDRGERIGPDPDNFDF